MSQQNQLDYAASYIKHLKERIEKLEKIKQQALMPTETCRDSTNNMTNSGGLRLPVFELRDLGSTIEVILISGLQKNFMLYEIISVLQQEGAEVVSASFSTVGDKIFHSIHAQVHSIYSCISLPFYILLLLLLLIIFFVFPHLHSLKLISP